MAGIAWLPGEKEKEWQIARQHLVSEAGNTLDDGTKLRRKDSGLSHSFMVIDGKILAFSGKGVYLGHGLEGKAKLAEDEQGNLFAVKIGSRLSSMEASIAHDLGVGGSVVIRRGLKHYLSYQYLGKSLARLIKEKGSLTLDECYALSIGAAVAVHHLHQGTYSKTSQHYFHYDLHLNNIVVDEQGHVSLIDYGRSSIALKDISELTIDITKLRHLLYWSLSDGRSEDYNEMIFKNTMMGDYYFTCVDEPPPKRFFRSMTVYLYLKEEENEKNEYERIWYAFKDKDGQIRRDFIAFHDINLSNLSSMDALDFYCSMPSTQLYREAIKQKIQDDCLGEKNQYLIDCLSTSSEQLTAMDIALKLTLSRFHLELFESEFVKHDLKRSITAIESLNSMSKDIFELYEQFNAFSEADQQYFKGHLVGLLLNNIDDDFVTRLTELKISEDLKSTIRTFFQKIEKNIIGCLKDQSNQHTQAYKNAMNEIRSEYIGLDDQKINPRI